MLSRQFLRRFSSKAKPYFVTTPIFYVNAAPHIGHLHSMVLADAITKWHAWVEPSTGVYLTTGTDEHGLKVQHASEQAGVPTRPFVDAAASKFKVLAEKAQIDAQRFIRTTDHDHIKAAQQLWTILQEKGYIYKGEHSGWYCVSDETFYPETQVSKDPTTGNMVSNETGKTVEWTSESNYFFALSKIQPQLLEYISNNRSFILPESRYNQIVKEVTSGLEDLSVSRPSSRCSWGIPVPGDESQVMYVWLDALTNYLTSSKYLEGKENQFWPADVHVIGKDIIRFHAIYWPAFLLAADIPPPKQLVVHSHWTMLGSKMSKSLGNVVDPIQTMEHFGVDSVKFFLLNDSYLSRDSDYSNDRIMDRHNTALVNKYGNLVVRLCGKAFNISRAVSTFPSSPESDIAKLTDSLLDKVRLHMQTFSTATALSEVQSLITAANLYVQDTAPWTLKKDLVKQDEVIREASEAARVASLVLKPFIPTIANKMLDRMGVSPDRRGVEWARYGKDAEYGVGANRKGDYPISVVE